MKPLVTNSTDVSVTTMKLSRPVGVFGVLVVVEFEMIVMVWGRGGMRNEDANTNERMEWSNNGKSLNKLL